MIRLILFEVLKKNKRLLALLDFTWTLPPISAVTEVMVGHEVLTWEAFLIPMSLLVGYLLVTIGFYLVLS